MNEKPEDRVQAPLKPRQRVISCAEVCLGIFIVVAHNVFHWIPNEVPILVILAVVSFRIREGNWFAGLYRGPKSWLRTILLAVACSVLLQLKDVILEPIGKHLWSGPIHVPSIVAHSGDLSHVLRNLVFVWLFAAFGEEIGYRGYLLRRAMDVFGSSRWGVSLALLIAAVSFGFGHFYKGPSGILESTGSGLILGGAYVWSRRLWVSSLTHGLNDTVALVFSFLGW